jgi:hypothetical protein
LKNFNATWLHVIVFAYTRFQADYQQKFPGQKRTFAIKPLYPISSLIATQCFSTSPPRKKKSHALQAFSNAQAFVAVFFQIIATKLDRGSSPELLFLFQVKEKVKPALQKRRTSVES